MTLYNVVQCCTTLYMAFTKELLLCHRRHRVQIKGIEIGSLLILILLYSLDRLSYIYTFRFNSVQRCGHEIPDWEKAHKILSRQVCRSEMSFCIVDGDK